MATRTPHSRIARNSSKSSLRFFTVAEVRALKLIAETCSYYLIQGGRVCSNQVKLCLDP
jgi:hypothetical protein